MRVSAAGLTCLLSLAAAAGAPPSFTFKGDLEGIGEGVRALTFSADGKLVVVGDDEGHVTVFNVEARKKIASFDSRHRTIHAMAVSPSTGLVATTGRDGFVRFWDAAKGTPVREFKVAGDPVFALAFDASGGALATGGEDKVVRVHDPDTGLLQAELKGHDDTIRSVAFVDGGKSLLSCASDKTLRLWDLQARRETRNQTERAAEYGDLQGFAVSTAGGAFVTLARELKRAEGGLRTLTGRGGSNVAETHVLILRDLASWTEQARLEAHLRTIRHAAFSSDGGLLASVGDDQALIVWDRAGKAKLAAFDLPDKQWAVQFSPDGGLLASGGDDKKVHLYAVKRPLEEKAAPPAQAAKVSAKDAYEQGRREFNLGHYEEARGLFEQAYKLQPVRGLLYNIGQCDRLLGNLEHAKRVYRAFVSESPADDPMVPQVTAKLNEIDSALKAQSTARDSPPSGLSNDKPQK